MMLSLCVFSLILGLGQTLLAGTQDQAIDQRVDALALQIQQLKERVSVLEITSNGTSSATLPIAFTASLSQVLTSVGSHQHIVFDRVITNIGNGYKPYDGHFVAPVRGAYVFFVVLTNMPQHSASGYLLKNGQFIGSVLAHGDSSASFFATSTLAVTVQLERNDQVWVQNEVKYGDTNEEIDGYNWSSFSGHLIDTN